MDRNTNARPSQLCARTSRHLTPYTHQHPATTPHTTHTHTTRPWPSGGPGVRQCGDSLDPMCRRQPSALHRRSSTPPPSLPYAKPQPLTCGDVTLRQPLRSTSLHQQPAVRNRRSCHAPSTHTPPHHRRRARLPSPPYAKQQLARGAMPLRQSLLGTSSLRRTVRKGGAVRYSHCSPALGVVS